MEKIKLEQKRSELLATREMLIEINAPSQHVQYIDMLLDDEEKGLLEFKPEDD